MSKYRKRIRGTTPEIEQAARRLRHRLTRAEVMLWQELKGRKLNGFRFRCQHPVGRFIADFYGPACQLIVEVDGEVHQQTQDYDRARTEHLYAYGYRVIRFSNDEIESNLQNVLATIQQHLTILEK